jgi:hypothetical protein
MSESEGRANSDLAIEVVDVRVEPYAAVPTLVFRLAITESSGDPVHAIALRTQIQIEPQRRRYTKEEESRLLELFGEQPQWGDSLRPFLWTHASNMLPGFTGRTEVDLPVACSYDFEVAAAKYLHSLGDGEIPLALLFSGTVLARRDGVVSVQPVPWHVEANYRLPVRVWRGLMDQYFPNGGWIRLRRETIDALTRYKAERAIPSWEDTIERLLKEAGA